MPVLDLFVAPICRVL